MPTDFLNAPITYRGDLSDDIEGRTVREFSRRVSHNSYNECGWLEYEEEENKYALDCSFESRDLTFDFTYFPSRTVVRLDIGDTATGVAFDRENAGNQFLFAGGGFGLFDRTISEGFLTQAERIAKEEAKRQEKLARNRRLEEFYEEGKALIARVQETYEAVPDKCRNDNVFVPYDDLKWNINQRMGYWNDVAPEARAERDEHRKSVARLEREFAQIKASCRG